MAEAKGGGSLAEAKGGGGRRSPPSLAARGRGQVGGRPQEKYGSRTAAKYREEMEVRGKEGGKGGEGAGRGGGGR